MEQGSLIGTAQLCLHWIFRANETVKWYYALVEPDHKHRPELQTLHTMHCCQAYTGGASMIRLPTRDHLGRHPQALQRRGIALNKRSGPRDEADILRMHPVDL